MNIAETITFDKDGQVRSRGREGVKKFFLTGLILLIALLAFGFGRLTAPEQGEGIKIEYDQALLNTSAALNSIENSKLKIDNSGTVWASSKGEKYYYAGCSGLSRVSEANKISFPSSQAAEASGFTLASGCQKQ